MLWGTQQRKGLIQKSRAGGWWWLPKPQEQPQAGQGGSHHLGCGTGTHGGPRLEVLESHRGPSEAAGGGDGVWGTEGEGTGAHGRGNGAPVPTAPGFYS